MQKDNRSHDIGKNFFSKEVSFKNIDLPPQVTLALSKLRSAGHIALIVGGWVRDSLLGFAPRDIDIITDASCHNIAHIFPNSHKVAGRFPHVVICVNKMYLEISTFHVPDVQERLLSEDNGPDDMCRIAALIQLDAPTRDFTINALYYCNISKKIFGCGNSYSDLDKKIIRFVGSPDSYIDSNPTSMLRAVRLAKTLSFRIDDDAKKKISQLSTKLSSLLIDRASVEIIKHLNCGKSIECLRAMCAYGLEANVFPYLSSILNNNEPFAISSLRCIDRAATQGARFSIEFILAAMLWSTVSDEVKNYRGALSNTYLNIFSTKLSLLAQENSIVHKFSSGILDVWHGHLLLLQALGSVSQAMLSSKNFLMCFNFLLLRVENNEIDAELLVPLERLMKVG